MTILKTTGFNGISPRTDPRLLPDNAATVAVNTKLQNGTIKPYKGTTQVSTLSKAGVIKSIYRFGEAVVGDANYWFHWTTDVDVVKGPLSDDTFERTYFTGDGAPKMTTNALALTGGTNYPMNSRALGLPSPANPITVGVSQGSGKVTITETQVSLLEVDDVLKVTIDGGTATTVTLTAGTGGDVTADSLAAQLDALAGISAVVTDGQVIITSGTAGDDSNVKIEKKSGETKSYAPADVTYQDFIAIVNGTNAVGETAAIGATVTLTGAQISGIEPDSYLSVFVNNNSPVAGPVSAGANTLPPVVTASSLKTALGFVPGITTTINEGATQTVTIVTTVTGAASSLTIKKVLPLVTPNYSILVDSASADPLSESRVYTYTYVTDLGEEGPPAAASEVVNVLDGVTVTLTNMSTTPEGPYNVTTKRIYRSVQGSGGAGYLFVAEVPAATTTYVDSVKAENLGESMLTLTWDAPPSDMQGLCIMANGIMAGFSGKDVCFSVPFVPSAWPVGYRLQSDHNIVGIGAFGISLFVGTDAFPYIITGTDPEGMSMVKSTSRQACVSKRSIVDMGGGVFYASPDGICLADATGIRVLTQDVLTRDEWQEYKPESIHATQIDGRYFAFYDTGATQGCLVLDMSGDGAKLWTSNVYYSAAFNDVKTDSLYLASSGSVQKWDSSASPLTYTWRSKIFQLAKPENLGAGQVLASTYPVMMKVYADGVLKHTQTVVNEQPFKLPAGFRARDWQLELSGTPEIYSAFLSTVVSELKQA